MSLGKKIIAGGIIATLLLIVAVVVGVFFVAPSVARSMVREKLDRAGQRFGLEISTGSIKTIGVAGVEITDLNVKDPQTGRTIASVATVGASLDTPSLLTGKRVIDTVWTRDVTVTITREDDGQFDLVRVLKRARGEKKEQEEPSDDSDGGGGVLRLFGGTLPEMDVQNINVVFAATPDAPIFPVTSLHIPSGEIEHDDGIALRGKVTVESVESPSWTVPSEVELVALLSDELEPQNLNVKFDRPVEVGGLEPYPFVRGGFAGIEMSPDKSITINDFHLGFQSQGREKPFLTTKRIGVGVADWALNPREMKLGVVQLDTPVLTLDYDRHGASALTDLDHAIRAPNARRIAASARTFAEKVAERKKPADEPEDVEEAVENEIAEAQAEAAEDKKGPTIWEKLAARLPAKIAVKSASAVVVDHRKLPVARPARTLRLEDGNFEIAHSVEEGMFSVDAAFRAIADEQPRGSVKSMVSFQYLTKTLDADIEIDALDLSWLGQILGADVAEHVRGGTLRGRVGVKPGSGGAVTIDGLASVENLVFYWDLLAEEPVEDFTASYSFVASYNPTASIPPAKLLKNGMFKESKTPPPSDPVYKGALVVQKGEATVGNVKATFAPSVYGTGALPSGLPARIDLRVALPQTDVQDLFDAVPVAIQGPLEGTKLAGSFAWNLDAEIPPHNAGDMEWSSVPVLEEFEIVEIPKDMDPNKLMTGFKLTITDTLTDKKGEEYEWTRTIRIPPAEPVSARYLVENGGLELEDLDERRREREWPKVPDPRRSFLPRTLLESPKYWYSAHAENQTAKKPWTAFDVIERTEKQPYGPYVFAPLQHIAPWVVRTVTTTEDGGFFRHPGFLFDSLKESVEDNIEAARFRRGASTISMQLVKNAFLDRQKLLARKMREAFIVFLMESVVNVPKSRILEVYLNVIEFGPGIYGIHDASVHYFGKRPDQLEIAEVAWLFSILPAPKKYHFYWERGEISDRWFSKMKRYIDAMYRRDKITEEERDAANAAPPAFYKPLPEEPVLKPTAPPAFNQIPLLFNDSFPNTPPANSPNTNTPAPSPTPTPLQNRPTNQQQPTEPKKKKKKGIGGWFR